MRPGRIVTSLARAREHDTSGRRRVRMLRWGASLAAIAAGCALDHHASARFVDPMLRKHAEPVVADRPRRDLVQVGAWEVRDVSVTRLRGAGRFGLEPEGRARRPSHLYRLTLEVARGGQSRWVAACEGRRAQAEAADYAAVLDEAHDVVSLACELTAADGDEVWEVRTQGSLRQNILGKASTSSRKGSYEIEILSRYKLFTLIQRETPIAVGQVRTGAGTVAAMTLARPEHVWLDAGDADEVGLWLALLAAHRFMPLGWND